MNPLRLALASLALAGCARPQPQETPERIGEFIKLMESTDLHLSSLEEEEDKARVERRLKSIRGNLTRAREMKLRHFGDDIEPYFDKFFAMLSEVESKPWGKEPFQRVMQGCTNCHDRFQK